MEWVRERDLVLWDGECGFCRRSADWITAQDRARAHRLEVVPYQDAPSPPMTPALALACERAVHIVTTDGKIVRAGRAALHVLGALGWPRLARLLALPPFIWALELGYFLVARNRRFFSRFLFKRRNR